MSRYLILIYGIISYFTGLLCLSWFALFIFGWDFLPLHIDSYTTYPPVVTALFINVLLLCVFVVQHSVMARPGFKQKLYKYISESAERSTYVLVSGVITCLVCVLWQPVAGQVWHIENELIRYLMIAGYAAGWLIAVIATFQINHFELFGLRQVYFNLIDKPMPETQFTEKYFYKLVRHPIQFGTLLGIWLTPTMSLNHFILSACLTAYVFLGLHYEEIDLVNRFGQKYKDYQKRVRMLLPVPKTQFYGKAADIH